MLGVVTEKRPDNAVLSWKRGHREGQANPVPPSQEARTPLLVAMVAFSSSQRKSWRARCPPSLFAGCVPQGQRRRTRGKPGNMPAGMDAREGTPGGGRDALQPGRVGRKGGASEAREPERRSRRPTPGMDAGGRNRAAWHEARRPYSGRALHAERRRRRQKEPARVAFRTWWPSSCAVKGTFRWCMVVQLFWLQSGVKRSGLGASASLASFRHLMPKLYARSD